MADEATDGEASRPGSPSPSLNDAFKARLQQFKYSQPSNLHGQRWSPRLNESIVPSSPARSASSPRKRSLLDQQLPDGSSVKEGDDEPGTDTTTTPSPKKRRSTTKERSARDPYNPVNHLVDSLRPGLTLVFIGLNPGLMTAATGHAYAHPSNRFWHILHTCGVTPKKHHPSETRNLMDLYEIGNTNICARPTRSGDGLSKAELEEGAVILETKIAEYKPQAVAIVGKGIWEAIWMMKKGQKRFNDPDFHWGWQDEGMQIGRTCDADGRIVWAGARTFVATSTSGLAATLTPAEKLAIWKPLGDWMAAQRADREEAKTRW